MFKSFNRRKQAKLHRLQDPSEVKEDSLSYERLEGSTHLRKKKREYLKEKLTSFNQTVRIRI
jgi:hypothetical protein